MRGKISVSARETIVIDENEISQLDEISLTSVMRQLTDAPETVQSQNTERQPPTTVHSSASSDSTINELLNDMAPSAEPFMESKSPSYGGLASDAEISDEAVDELLSADVLFPGGVDD